MATVAIVTAVVTGVITAAVAATAATGTAIAVNNYRQRRTAGSDNTQPRRRNTATDTQASGATINTTADSQPSVATVRRRNTATTRCENSYEISPRGGLLCDMECMIIGSFGDQHAPGVRAVHKASSTSIGSFLPGVCQDLEKIQSLIRNDPSKTLIYSLVDFPGEECLCSKQEYLEKIEEFLQRCQTPGGETFCLAEVDL